MSAPTSIEWTDYSWNPVSGCTKVSRGCDHCYAETIATRFAGSTAYPDGFEVTLKPERLTDPLRKRSWRGKRVFVNSMSDLFHKDVPDEYIARVFAVMQLCPEITFQVLTKRHGRMRSLLSSGQFADAVWVQATELMGERDLPARSFVHPAPNVWLGVSVEDQAAADLRIPALRDTLAAVRFLSCEPLLGPVCLDLMHSTDGHAPGSSAPSEADERIDWIIVGGESGPGARPMHPDWARSLRDQCAAAGVPFLFKQWGEWAPDERTDEDGSRRVGRKPDASDPRSLVIHPAGMTALTPENPFDPWERGHPNWHTVMRRVGKKAAGRELDGRTHDAMPGVAPC